MVYLEYFLYLRCAVLWEKRHLPSVSHHDAEKSSSALLIFSRQYLGPDVYQLVHLFLLAVTNSLVLFALILLLGRSVWSLCLNQTTIESWEIERHHALLRRARTLGGFLYGPDGSKITITHQEFPWDIGIFANVAQAFGTKNVIAWLWPFAGNLSIESGLAFEHNEIEDPSKPWPPPDPDRMFRAPVHKQMTGEDEDFTQVLDKDAFKQRQAADMARYADKDGDFVIRRKPFHERLEDMQGRDARRVYEVDDNDVAVESDDDYGSDEDHNLSRKRKDITMDDGAGEEGWRNREGERLADFGVDEVAEFYDEDDLPLSELMRRKQKVR